MQKWEIAKEQGLKCAANILNPAHLHNDTDVEIVKRQLGQMRPCVAEMREKLPNDAITKSLSKKAAILQEALTVAAWQAAVRDFNDSMVADEIDAGIGGADCGW